MSVLVFVGPGIGHYTPIASYLRDCDLGDDVVMVSDVPPDSSLARRIIHDGFRYEQLQYRRTSDLASRVFHKVLKRSLDRAIEATARNLESPDVPHLVARTLFVLRSVTREIGNMSPTRTEAIRALVRAHRPSIVFADTVASQPMPAVMGPENVPWVMHEVCPVNTSSPGRPLYPAGLSPDLRGFESVVNRATGIAGRMRKERRDMRLDRMYPGFATHEHAEPRIKIAFTVAALDDFESCPQSDFSYVGVSPRELVRVPVASPPSGLPVVYVSFGSAGVPAARRLYETVIDGFRARPVHLVLQIVDEQIAAEIKGFAESAPGPTIEIMKAFDGHPTELLSRADLVIGHGGYRTIVEALAFGVPVLVIPNIAADRLEVARRILEHGCGGSLNYYRVTPADIDREAWRLLRSSDVKEAAMRIRARMTDTSERDRTIQVVREVVSERSPRS